MRNNNFDEVLKYLPDELRAILSALSESIKSNTYEIRLRAFKPLIICGSYGVKCVKSDFTSSSVDMNGACIVLPEHIQLITAAISNYSVYSHQNDIASGYITFGNGNRAGFSGDAVVENNRVMMIRDIRGINIRIAANNISLTEEIKKCMLSFNGIIVAGAPCSGKTTILRAIAQALSSEYIFGFRKVVVVDERCELSCNDGLNCDILCGYPKEIGIEHAIRTLSPDIIVCDEITSLNQVELITQGLYCGVRFIVSVHCSCTEDLLKRIVSRALIDTSFFDKIILLNSGYEAGEVSRIIKTEELFHDKYIVSDNNSHISSCGIYDYQKGKCTLQDTY